MQTTPRAFGDLLKRFRLQVGLSQEALAERAGLSPRGVSDLERGILMNPRPATVRLLADALGLSEGERASFLAAAQGTTMPMVGSATTPVASPPPRARLAPPSGTVTFLFTDMEGSTQLLQRLGDRYADVLDQHRRLLRDAFAAHGGYEVDTQGDSFFIAFPTAPDALAAAVEATRALAVSPWPDGVVVRVRMGLHSGAPQLVDEGYVGLDVHRAARIAATGHGGQILLSVATFGLVQGTMPEGMRLRDLGAHRLKDLQQAERIYQAVLADLPSDFPPLKALDARPHNLPVQTGLLLGREREVSAVGALLRREGVRLVTLTGAGGIGKTRLSLQVAAEVLDAFADGVWLVRLSRLTDPALVVPTIALVFDLKEAGATPIADVLRGYLRDKRLLLVLDNFEQVVAAAPAVAEVLAGCPGVRVLVTSRVPLHLSGEHEYALKPLALPDPAHLPPLDSLAQYAAVALFVERAKAARADFMVTDATAWAVAQVCARLDGFPLAIELAAARVKLLPPVALLKRLDRALPLLSGGARDLDERQQTMRNTLAWSYNLLHFEERALFRRLAVFVGGCTLEAAEAVCATPEGAEPLEFDVVDGLSALIDQSLLQQTEEEGESRFTMLHVVREFALELLEASGEAEAVKRAHAAYYLQRPESQNAFEMFRPASDPACMRWFEQEHDNLRSALRWAIEHREVETALRLATGLALFWQNAGNRREGLRWLEDVLALVDTECGDGAVQNHQLRASRLCYLMGFMVYFSLSVGDVSRAISASEQDLALARSVGDKRLLALAYAAAAYAAFTVRDFRRSLDLYEDGEGVAREAGDKQILVGFLINFSVTLLESHRSHAAPHGPVSDFRRAQQLAREAHTLASDNGEYLVRVSALIQLARLAATEDAWDNVQSYALRALWMLSQGGVIWKVNDCLFLLGLVAAREERHVRLARILGTCTALAQRCGIEWIPEKDADLVEGVVRARAALGEEAWAAAYAEGQALSLDEAIAEALGESGVAARCVVDG